MSEGKHKDDMRRGAPLPTSAERAERKPPSTREFHKAAYAILFSGVGAFFFVLVLILWPSVPPVYQTAIIGFFYWPYFPYGVAAIPITVAVSFLGLNLYRKVRARGKVQESSQGTEQATAPESPAVQPAARAPPVKPSTSEAIFVKCRLCPQTFRADRPNGEPWITLLNHVFEHYKELAYVRDEYPDQEFMYEIMHKWYEEIKQ